MNLCPSACHADAHQTELLGPALILEIDPLMPGLVTHLTAHQICKMCIQSLGHEFQPQASNITYVKTDHEIISVGNLPLPLNLGGQLYHVSDKRILSTGKLLCSWRSKPTQE